MDIIEIDSSSDNFTSQETSFQDVLFHDSSQDHNQDFSQDIQDSSQNLQDTSDIHNQITKVKKPRSIVHNYFTLNIEKNRYECNHCNKSYQVAKDSSTSTLRKHLKEQHGDLLGLNQITDAMNELNISEKLVYILFYYYEILHNLYLLFMSLIHLIYILLMKIKL